MTGIYRDRYGLAGIVKVKGTQREHRFPVGTSLREIQDWRERTRIALLEDTPDVPRHSLAADVQRYLKLVKSRLTSYRDRKRDLASWVEVLGADADRRLLTAREIQAQLQSWRSELAASTVNHRRDALSHLYRVLDGEPGIMAKVTRFKPPPPERRALPLARIDSVLSLLPPGRTRARLMLMRWTGMRPSQLARLEPGDFLEAAIRVPAGKGGRGVAIPLVTEAAKAAAAAFVAGKCWGAWSCSSAYKLITQAAERAGVEPFNVYAIRHSWASALRAAGVDLADVQKLLGHTSPATTERYAPVVDSKLVEAVGRLAVADGSGRAPWPPDFD